MNHQGQGGGRGYPYLSGLTTKKIYIFVCLPYKGLFSQDKKAYTLGLKVRGASVHTHWLNSTVRLTLKCGREKRAIALTRS